MSASMIGIDLFCGVGGMSLGFELAGIHVAAAFDNDPMAVKYHGLNFPGCRSVKANLRRASGEELRRLGGLGDSKIDVVFGGSPCQGFSFGGTHETRDSRNGLLIQFARLVGELEPDYFVLENVKGLLAPGHRPKLRRFRHVVEKAGYEVVLPVRVLDASHFGVPQRRERVFVLGARRGRRLPAYPEGRVDGAPTVRDAIGDLLCVDHSGRFRCEGDYTGPSGRRSAYAAMLADLAAGRPVCGFAQTNHCAQVLKRFRRTAQGAREPVSRFHRLSWNGISPTLRAGTGPEKGSFMAPRPIHPVRPRCIYPREAARLHSFPDSFVFHRTLWHAFRQIGNSVPPFFAKAIAEKIVEAARSSTQMRRAP